MHVWPHSETGVKITLREVVLQSLLPLYPSQAISSRIYKLFENVL